MKPTPADPLLSDLTARVETLERRLKELDSGVTVADAARLLTTSRRTLYEWKTRGLIDIRKIGGRAIVPMSEISRLLGTTAQT